MSTPSPQGQRRSTPQWLLPGALGVLLLGALAFALLAGGSGDSSSSSRSSQGASSSSAAVEPSSGSAQGAETQASGFDGAAIPGRVQAPGFSLTDQYERPISLGSLRGQPVLLAFLYTNGCGASCIVIAQQIRGALNELARPIPVLVVSVDPRGDTPASIRAFLARVSLGGRVYYLTGSQAQLARVWHDYRVTPASAGVTAFTRAASVLLVDKQGDERVLYGPEQLTPEALSHDIAKLDGDSEHP